MKYVFDIILTLIILFFSFVALLINIPGYGEICDGDSYFILISFLIFIPTSIIFLVVTIPKLSKRKKSRFRKTPLIIFLVLMVLNFGGLNKLIFLTYFGKERYIAESTKMNLIELKLYENGKFYSSSFLSSCYEQIVGTYKISNKYLELTYDKKSEFISKKYKIQDSLLISLNEKKSTLSIK